MKKLLGIVVLGFWIIFYSDSFSATKNEKINEIDKMFASGLLSKEECTKFKKVILGEDSKPICEDTKANLLTINNPTLTKEPLTAINQIKALGIFTEPAYYPMGMVKFFGKNCNKFRCRANKATKKMAFIFKRKEKYHQKHPGVQLYAMAKQSDDALQIVEQILPFFQPDYTLTINDMADMGIKLSLIHI